MHYGSPFEAYLVEKLREFEDKQKKDKEKAKKPVTFSFFEVLSVFAFSPLIAWGMARLFAWCWNDLVNVLHTLH